MSCRASTASDMTLPAKHDIAELLIVASRQRLMACTDPAASLFHTQIMMPVLRIVSASISRGLGSFPSTGKAKMQVNTGIEDLQAKV